MIFLNDLNQSMGPGELRFEKLMSLLKGKFTELEQVIRLALNEEPDNGQYLLMLSLLDQLEGDVREMEEDVSKINETLNQLNSLRRAQTESISEP